MDSINQEKFGTHYYGDVVRKYFLAAAGVMLISLPFFQNLINVPVTISIFAILIVGIAAGLINPRYTWTTILNASIAVLGTAIFEYYAIDAYNTYAFDNFLFLTDQLLAIIFLIALYFGIKTARGTLYKKF